MFSAGTDPEDEVHRSRLRFCRDAFDVDTRNLYPKDLKRFVGHTFDYVITVCDRTAERCPTFPGDPERIHWSFEDPTAVEGEEARRRAFETVANGLAARLRIWMALPAVHRRLDEPEEPNVRLNPGDRSRKKDRYPSRTHLPSECRARADRWPCVTSSSKRAHIPLLRCQIGRMLSTATGLLRGHRQS